MMIKSLAAEYVVLQSCAPSHPSLSSSLSAPCRVLQAKSLRDLACDTISAVIRGCDSQTELVAAAMSHHGYMDATCHGQK
jgi:hypothetical protein